MNKKKKGFRVIIFGMCLLISYLGCNVSNSGKQNQEEADLIIEPSMIKIDVTGEYSNLVDSRNDSTDVRILINERYQPDPEREDYRYKSFSLEMIGYVYNSEHTEVIDFIDVKMTIYKLGLKSGEKYSRFEIEDNSRNNINPDTFYVNLVARDGNETIEQGELESGSLEIIELSQFHIKGAFEINYKEGAKIRKVEVEFYQSFLEN